MQGKALKGIYGISGGMSGDTGTSYGSMHVGS